MSKFEEILYNACERGDVRTAEKILNEHHVNVNWENPRSNWTILIVAVIEGNKECVKKLLLDPSIDVNMCNSNDRGRWSPLHHSVFYGHVGITKYLLQTKGIEFRKTDRYGKRPYDRARSRGVKNLLRQHRVRRLYIDKQRKQFNHNLQKLRKEGSPKTLEPQSTTTRDTRSSISIKSADDAMRNFQSESSEYVRIKQKSRRRSRSTVNEVMKAPPIFNKRKKRKKRSKRKKRIRKEKRLMKNEKNEENVTSKKNEEFELLMILKKKIKSKEKELETKDEMIREKDLIIENQTSQIKKLRDKLKKYSDEIIKDL